MKQERIDPGWAWTKKYGISPGVKVGDTVYLSGNSAFDNDSSNSQNAAHSSLQAAGARNDRNAENR